MKDIQPYHAPKYDREPYQFISDNIYQSGDEYYSSYSFVQEPELGEGTDAAMISQYPLEDLLEEYYVYVTDFYDDLNVSGETICRLEFASPDVADLEKLREIVGKHVYNRAVEKDGQGYVLLVVE